MTIFNKTEKATAGAIGALGYTNPFLQQRMDLERQILGRSFRDLQLVWSADMKVMTDNPNVEQITTRAESLAGKTRAKLCNNQSPTEEEVRIYQELVLYVLFYRYQDAFHQYILSPSPKRLPSFKTFKDTVAHFLHVPGIPQNPTYDPAHLFATTFVMRRAFHFVFRHILGTSMPVARLRASTWQSILTADVRRYIRLMYKKMNTIATLITGPSGTGKELVASAIGLSRYIPFDEKQGAFAEDFQNTYRPLNLSALSRGILEGELFGYAKGAFTGAAKDVVGFLEDANSMHTVFLDEIGEIDEDIQVKLLRVLQSGEFHRLGERKLRRFSGKIISATNRCLADEIQNGNFRSDLYYRLCADVVVTPSLRAQLDDDPQQLPQLLESAAAKIVGLDECTQVASQTNHWINNHLPQGYPWPGNMRELEQCVRSVVVNGEYIPLAPVEKPSCSSTLHNQMESGALTAEELVTRYCKMVFSQNHNFVETGRLIGLDRRTVKAKVESE